MGNLDSALLDGKDEAELVSCKWGGLAAMVGGEPASVGTVEPWLDSRLKVEVAEAV